MGQNQLDAKCLRYSFRAIRSSDISALYMVAPVSGRIGDVDVTVKLDCMVIRIEYRTIGNNGVVCCCQGESCTSWPSVATRSQFGRAARAYARHILLWAGVVFFALFALSSNGAGFQEFTSDDVQFGIWYPTDTPLTLQRLGPFETKMAHDAPPRPGEYPVVLFSHGNGGRYRNHYLTAEAVADAISW